MDVGAVSSGRAEFEAVRYRRAEPEPGPILVARTGLAPIRELAQDDMLRAGLRQRSALHDLDSVLSQPEPEPEPESRQAR